jgi:flagellin-specific chaperone FliS
MRLSKEAIKEFKDIYEKEFRETISDEKAQELGQNLISLFKIIYRPIPENKEEKNNKDDQDNKKP